jgi:hypothetical protein
LHSFDGDGVEVLWRAEKSKSRVTEGSGLGLSVVKSIARAHTGNVRVVDGPEGQGTAVVIFIPLTSAGFYPDFTDSFLHCWQNHLYIPCYKNQQQSLDIMLTHLLKLIYLNEGNIC